MSVQLDKYFERLRADAKRGGLAFTSSTEEVEDGLQYQWKGQAHGRGLLKTSHLCGRIFFLEVVSTRGASILPEFRRLKDGFQTHGGEAMEPWGLFGMQVRLPSGLVVARPTLQAGRTSLSFSGRGVDLVVDRWGFGEQLLDKHGIENWSRAALGLEGWQAEPTEAGLKWTRAPKLGSKEGIALVRYERDRNQIVSITAKSRKLLDPPQWDWFT